MSTSILSTMPLPAEWLHTATEHDIQVDCMSFIEVVPVTNDANLNEQVSAIRQQNAVVVFTSASAVEAVCRQNNFSAPDWKIYCIEKATLKAVNKYFPASQVAGTGMNAEELAGKIMADNEVKEVVFFCGDKRMDTLPTTLLNKGIITREITVYKTEERPQFIEKEYNGYLFYSPSGVSSFFTMNEVPETAVLFAIGHTTAHALKLECANNIVVSEQPSKEILLQTAVDHFTTINQ